STCAGAATTAPWWRSRRCRSWRPAGASPGGWRTGSGGCSGRCCATGSWPWARPLRRGGAASRWRWPWPAPPRCAGSCAWSGGEAVRRERLAAPGGLPLAAALAVLPLLEAREAAAPAVALGGLGLLLYAVAITGLWPGALGWSLG